MYISLFHCGSKLPASQGWSGSLLVNSGVPASLFMKGKRAEDFEESGETKEI